VISAGLVDVHSHVVPSGDDGATSVAESEALCELAAAAGTAVLFATPHMHAPWDSYPWTAARGELYERAFRRVRAYAATLGLDLRRGREVFPSEVLDADPAGLRLEGTEAVLVELPGTGLDLHGQLDLTAQACRRIETAGLTPVLAHPERCREVAADPLALEAFAARGWLLCVNAPSLTGGHGATAERVAWALVEAGLVSLVASDGHRARRPPTLDRALDVAVERLGPARARPLFDGSALPWSAPGTLVAAS
jgi:protein-tyrosine phosphatase